jgi:hypothetical protein
LACKENLVALIGEGRHADSIARMRGDWGCANRGAQRGVAAARLI